MAKKQQPKLSYGPNMGLIAGEAQVAQSEANLGNAVGAFAQGFQTVFGAIQKEEEERAAKMEAYAAEFPGLEQMNFMANATNKQVVTDFLNTQRDEYSKLAATYEKTKDRKVMDKMNAIKFSIANLDDQIKVFNQDKQEYRTAFDENQLADPQVFDKDFYTNIFTNNSKFSVAENGDIAFDVSGKKNKSNLYKDHAGNWTSRNNISESSFLEMYSKAQASGEKGNAFYRDTTYRALLSNLKATGNEGLQTFVTTDLTGDDSDFTFQQQWASGSLDDKFYKGRKKEDGTDWMFDNKNAGELRKLVADYYTDVVEDGYKTGKGNYVDPDGGGGNDGNYYGFGQFRVKTGGGGAVPKSITAATASQRRTYLDDFGQVDGEHGQYIWNENLGDNGMYVRQDDSKELSMFEVARDEGLIKPGESASNFNPTTKTEQNLDKNRDESGLATSSMMKTGSGDDAVSAALNEKFTLTGGKQGLIFAPWSALNKQGANYKEADAIGTNDITILIPDKTGTGAKPLLDENGNQYRFGTFKDFKQSELDIINKIMENANQVSKQIELP